MTQTTDVKEVLSKYKISLTTLFVVLPSIFGGLTVIDGRYAHASDEKKAHFEYNKALTSFREEDLEDKIFILQMKKAQSKQANKKVDPIDDAMLDRYEKKLKSLKDDSERTGR